MMNRLMLLAATCLAATATAAAQQKPGGAQEPSKPDAAEPLAAYVPDPKPEKIADGFRFTEGPLWHPDGYLIFSDIPADTVYKWTPKGGAEPMRHPAGSPNGNALDLRGRLVTAQHDGHVTRTDAAGKTEVLADAYQGKSLNSPNDVTIKSDGSIYFTDPPFGTRGRQRQLDFCGVYRLDPSGDLTLLSRDLSLPNGIAFSPDESILYVSDSQTAKVHAFDVKADGTLGDHHVLADLASPDASGLADGLKVDREGNVYATGPGGVFVITPGGAIVGRIDIAGASNVAFGGDDGKSLFITARRAVYRVRTTHSGAVRPVGNPDAPAPAKDEPKSE